MFPAKEWEGGGIAVDLPALPGKRIPDHQTVNITVQELDVEPRKEHLNPTREIYRREDTTVTAPAPVAHLGMRNSQ